MASAKVVEIATDEEININLAVYMERLDTYIKTQSDLNRTICNNLESLDKRLDEVQDWRSRIYGVKTSLAAVGLLIVHTTAVMVGFLALLKWGN